jgi:AcrR family transcriptional regulator
MATSYSANTVRLPGAALTRPGGRREEQRARTVEEALDLAVDVMTEVGVGGLTISEVARRMGMRPPSLYKYFASLHDLYDALFARGLTANEHVVRQASEGMPAGVEMIRTASRAIVHWCVENPALAQLLYWRVVPGFEPSPATFAASHDQMRDLRHAFTEAVRQGRLLPQADSDQAVRLLTVVISGLITQQMANEPSATFEAGAFTALTDEALDMFFAAYAPTPQRRN